MGRANTGGAESQSNRLLEIRHSEHTQLVPEDHDAERPGALHRTLRSSDHHVRSTRIPACRADYCCSWQSVSSYLSADVPSEKRLPPMASISSMKITHG